MTFSEEAKKGRVALELQEFVCNQFLGTDQSLIGSISQDFTLTYVHDT